VIRKHATCMYVHVCMCYIYIYIYMQTICIHMGAKIPIVRWFRRLYIGLYVCTRIIRIDVIPSLADVYICEF
jgi:hypothetical protein